MSNTIIASNLGFPRIGSKRELKKALESYWAGRSTQEELKAVGQSLRKQNLLWQREAGLDHIPSNDFSFYDHVLDTAAMVGAVPRRFAWDGKAISLDTYFLMARGATSPNFVSDAQSLPNARPLEMTKWFNTNYHYIVPELESNQKFQLSSSKCVDEFLEAKALGIITRPVLLGPVSFLKLAKIEGGNAGRFRNLDGLLEVYAEVFAQLKAAGAQWIQMDEPCLAADMDESDLSALAKSYSFLAKARGNLRLLLASYFGSLANNKEAAVRLEIDALHIDLVSGKDELDWLLNALPKNVSLSAGVVDGHNIWRCKLDDTIDLLEHISNKIGKDRLIIAPSCSLLHVPIDLELETALNPEIKSWLAFAKQKLEEISLLKKALCSGRKAIESALNENESSFKSRAISSETNNAAVKNRLSQIDDKMCSRESAYPERRKSQVARFKLPLLPTTTIGSFPQTQEVRLARKELRAGRLSLEQYDTQMRDAIAKNILLQEDMGIDVLVHGEPERSDMVEFFAEKLQGLALTEHGWVQSYGSRYVKPPIIFGDVLRPDSMTVDYAKFAQSKTKKPVKGMLTGPVTMLYWSFVRDDQPRSATCAQLALVIRDEVKDLEASGIGIIQIDEPAIREGLPLKKADWADYLSWAVRSFRLASSGVADDTQIHTHMCYSEFNDIINAVAAMDADVISIEAARSSMDLLDTLQQQAYPNEIGPGVYDIHSPLIPAQEDMEELIRKALKVIPVEKLWINPDCGLKTRAWKEVNPALNAMVQAALNLRSQLALLIH